MNSNPHFLCHSLAFPKEIYCCGEKYVSRSVMSFFSELQKITLIERIVNTRMESLAVPTRKGSVLR